MRAIGQTTLTRTYLRMTHIHMPLALALVPLRVQTVFIAERSCLYAFVVRSRTRTRTCTRHTRHTHTPTKRIPTRVLLSTQKNVKKY